MATDAGAATIYVVTDSHETQAGNTAKPLPLILARELATSLATPMYLMDARGMLVFYNDAAAVLIGKTFGELGEIPGSEFAAVMQLATAEGEPVSMRDTPAGVAFFERRPHHRALYATAYDGVRRFVDATAYPLFGAAGEMYGVVSVFWERASTEPRT